MNATGAGAYARERFFGPVDAPDIPEVLALLPVQVTPDVSRREQDELLDTADWWFAQAGAWLRIRTVDGMGTLCVEPRREEAEIPGGMSAWMERLGVVRPQLPGPCPGHELGARLRELVRGAAVAVKATAELDVRRHRLVYDGARLMARQTTVRIGAPGAGLGFCEVVIEALSPKEEGLEAIAAPFADDDRFQAAGHSLSDEILRVAGAGIPAPHEGEDLLLRPEDRFVDAAYRVLRLHAGRMLWNEPGTRLGLDAEYLHDMRVASRRLREALRVFRDALPARRVQALRRHLRWIGNGLGRVRDLDVHLTDLEEEARNVPFSLRSGLLLYRDLLRARRSKAREALLRMLATRRYAGFVESFGSFLRKGAPKRPSAPAAAEPVTTAARAAIRRRLKRVLKDGRAVGPDTPDEELHRLRIRCKRLRYTCEFFAGLYGAPAEDMARRAKSVQDVLGRHQDSVVAADTLAAAAQDVRAPRREGRDMLMAMGYLTAWHGERARQARRGFRKRWRKLDRKKVRKRLRSKMDRLAAKPT